MRWWTLRSGPERQRQKRLAAERPPRGTIRHTENGFLGRGGFWPYDGKGTKRFAELGALSGLPPALDLVEPVIEGDTCSLLGKRSGNMYTLYLDTVATFRACYSASVRCERKWRPREVRTNRISLEALWLEPARDGKQCT